MSNFQHSNHALQKEDSAERSPEDLSVKCFDRFESDDEFKSQAKLSINNNIEEMSNERFERLALRLKATKSIPPRGERVRADVEAAAAAVGVHPATLYRDMLRLEGRGSVRDLLPKALGFPKGRSRLSARQEEVISLCIQSHFLTLARPSTVKVAKKIGDMCEDEGLPRPSRATVIRRLNAIPKRIVALKRHGPKAAEQQTPRPGRYVVARPWDVWQIDHTLADVIVVDRDGKPIGRVWLTIVLDVCTRMVVAYYVGLEPPSTIRVAATLDLAVSPKAAWLAARGLDYVWPAKGLPLLLHSDRAKEFTSPNLRRALLNHGTDTFYRPPGRTRFGGHIERLIGTMMGTCRLLPGATHNSPSARGNYDSKGAARLGIDDLEMYFAHQILGIYHHAKHSALGMSPLDAWAKRPKGWEPECPGDMETFRLDLFPECSRTITRQGVSAFGDEYYSRELGEAYIAGARKVVVKYDPRDLSQIYVRVANGRYLVVPYRLQREEPAPTLWLHKAGRRARTQAGDSSRDRATIRRANEAAERVIEESLKSDKIKRQAERLRRDRLAAAEFRSAMPAPSTPDDDDWGGAFGGGEP